MGDVNSGTPAAPAAPTQNSTDPKSAPQAGAIPGAPGSQAPNQTGNPVKDAAQAAARRIKIDDQEIDEDEVVKVYRARNSHQKAANKEYQEGLKLRKQNEQFIQAMQNPETLIQTLQKMGWEPNKIRSVAEKYLAGVLEDEMMDPKDKELKTTKQRLEDYEKKEKASREAEEQRHHDALKKKFADDYSKEFIEALTATNLPPTKSNVGKMAGYISRAAKIKMPMTANEAAKLVQQDIKNDLQYSFKDLTSDQIIQLVGEDGLKKLREYDTSRLKDPNQHLKTPGGQGNKEPRKKEPGTQRMTTAEWRAFNRK